MQSEIEKLGFPPSTRYPNDDVGCWGRQESRQAKPRQGPGLWIVAQPSLPPPRIPRADLRGRPLSSGGSTVTHTLGAERSSWAAAWGPRLGSVWPHTRSRRAPGRSPAVSANVKRSTRVMKPSASTSKPRRPCPSRGGASSRVSQPRLTSWAERVGRGCKRAEQGEGHPRDPNPNQGL